MSRALFALLLAIAPCTAEAQPSVRVRAEARIELRVERGPGLVSVRGNLRDDLGQPLGDRAIEVRVQDETEARLRSASARTDAQGAFAAAFPLETGTYRVLATWEGDEGHPRIEVPQVLDLTRAHVRLEVGVQDGRLDLDRPAHAVEVRASSDEGGAGLRVELRNELDRVLAEGTTDAEGRARFRIESARLGPPAAGRLIAHTRGDDRRGEAQTEVPIVRYRPTVLTLRAASARVRDDAVTLSGELTDSTGPLARRAVGLFAGTEHLDTLLTDDEGRFSRSVALEPVEGSDRVVLTARFASDAPWRPPAISAPVTLAIEGAGSTPWSWLLAPILVCGLAIGLLSRGRRAAPAPAIASDRATAPPGIAPARPSGGLAAALREVRGVVMDADAGSPLAGATIALVRSGKRIESAAGTDGRFEIVAADGELWTLEVSAPGYERSTAAVQLPHRGQWSRTTVRLRSLRELALASYRPVAEALAPARRWWGFWTPRELVEGATSHRDELDALTSAVERAAYAEPAPDEAEVSAIADRSAQMASEIER